MDDVELRAARELTTRIIAYTFIAIFVALLGVAVFVGVYFPESDYRFKNVKQVIDLVSPLLGVIVGFYFSKASTEARAENAEQQAKQATTERQSTEKKLQDTRGALSQLEGAASALSSPLVAGPQAAAGGAGGGGDAGGHRNQSLQLALERARRVQADQ